MCWNEFNWTGLGSLLSHLSAFRDGILKILDSLKNFRQFQEGLILWSEARKWLFPVFLLQNIIHMQFHMCYNELNWTGSASLVGRFSALCDGIFKILESLKNFRQF